MGKRSNFARVPRDLYPTPAAAVTPLLPHLSPGTRYTEPCAGDGALIRHLAAAGHQCVWASDIVPIAPGIAQMDAMDAPLVGDCVLTNPPWDRAVLHPMIERFEWAWLLFDSDWVHTRQSAKFMPRLHKIVSVGRVKWIPGSKMTGKDNCAWYLFGPERGVAPEFYGRSA